MTKGLLISSQHKGKLYRQCKSKSKDHPKFIKYKSYTTLYNKLRRKAKHMYINSILTHYRHNAAKTWGVIKRLLGKTSNKKTCIEQLVVNNDHITDQHEIAEQFCEFFADVGKNQSTRIGKSTKTAEEYFPGIFNEKTLFFRPTDAREVTLTVLSMKPKNSTGYDNISSRSLQYIVEGIAQPLALLINRSFLEGTFPDTLKLAIVVPIYKKR